MVMHVPWVTCVQYVPCRDAPSDINTASRRCAVLIGSRSENCKSDRAKSRTVLCCRSAGSGVDVKQQLELEQGSLQSLGHQPRRSPCEAKGKESLHSLRRGGFLHWLWAVATSPATALLST